jgi:starvation-inducible DNA-binding protein
MENRSRIAGLRSRLADGLDLHSQIKVAHWNIKGPQVRGAPPALRDVRGLARGAQRLDRRARRDAGRARLRHRAPRRNRQAREQVQAQNDSDSWDLLSTIIPEFEKHAWFLRASLDS